MSSLNTDLYNKNVRRNNKYKEVVDLLVFGSLDGQKNTDKKIFDNIKDLIVFAAMVGKKKEKKESVESKDNTAIILGTFSGSGSSKGSRVDQHNIIFMFGLLTHKDMKFMRDEHVNEVINIFEDYSNGGLSVIKDWLVESAWNPLIILDKMTDELNSEEKSGIDVPENPFL